MSPEPSKTTREQGVSRWHEDLMDGINTKCTGGQLGEVKASAPALRYGTMDHE